MKTIAGLMLTSLCAWIATSWFITQGSETLGDKSAKIDVRALQFKPTDSSFFIHVGGQNKVTTLINTASMEKLLGKGNAKALASQVDFGKEKIVLVSWTTSGPPEGTLKYEVKGTGKDCRVTFYVQGPPGATIRGQRARIAADFFAVPRNAVVLFDPQERN